MKVPTIFTHVLALIFSYILVSFAVSTVLLCFSKKLNAAEFDLEFKADVEVGYVHGFHMNTKGMNDSHKFARIGFANNFNLSYFENSFSKDSFGISYRIKDRAFTLDIGLVSGYSKDNMADFVPFIGDYMLVFVPQISIPVEKNVDFKVILLGDSINFGYSISF